MRWRRGGGNDYLYPTRSTCFAFLQVFDDHTKKPQKSTWENVRDCCAPTLTYLSGKPADQLRDVADEPGHQSNKMAPLFLDIWLVLATTTSTHVFLYRNKKKATILNKNVDFGKKSFVHFLEMCAWSGRARPAFGPSIATACCLQRGAVSKAVHADNDSKMLSHVSSTTVWKKKNCWETGTTTVLCYFVGRRGQSVVKCPRRGSWHEEWEADK